MRKFWNFLCTLSVLGVFLFSVVSHGKNNKEVENYLTIKKISILGDIYFSVTWNQEAEEKIQVMGRHFLGLSQLKSLNHSYSRKNFRIFGSKSKAVRQMSTLGSFLFLPFSPRVLQFYLENFLKFPFYNQKLRLLVEKVGLDCISVPSQRFTPLWLDFNYAKEIIKSILELILADKAEEPAQQKPQGNKFLDIWPFSSRNHELAQPSTTGRLAWAAVKFKSFTSKVPSEEDVTNFFRLCDSLPAKLLFSGLVALVQDRCLAIIMGVANRYYYHHCMKSLPQVARAMDILEQIELQKSQESNEIYFSSFSEAENFWHIFQILMLNNHLRS